MRKRLLRCMTLTICLCLLMCGSMTAAASPELENVSGGSGGSISQVDGGETPSVPEPVKDAKYIITIAAPRGWYTKSATATIKLEDVNGTGFEKAEAKLGSNASWQDISDSLRSYGWAYLDLSDNNTVYVTVTNKKGKAHVKSLYIECFDRESPTVRAKIEGRTLRVEADDSLSGVEYIYVNGYRFDDLVNGTLDIRAKDYTDADEEDIFVQAVDYAGNKSKTVSVKNPNYKTASSSASETSQSSASSAPTSSSAPAASAPAAASASQAAASSAAPAASDAPVQAEQPAASEKSGNNSVTPTDGTGTVIENSVKTPEEREFFTITTEAGNDYYIVVDKQKSDKNVYLLSEVTEDDLTGLAKPSATEPAIPEYVQSVPPVTPELDPVPSDKEPGPESAPQKTSDTGMVIMVVLAVIIGGGAGWYFKIYKPKQEAYDDDDGEDWGGGDSDCDETDDPDSDEFDMPEQTENEGEV